MKYRTEALLDAETASTAATKTVDVDLSQPVSRLVVEMKGTNNGSTPTAHPATMLTKLELVDGSDVLFSLSGKEAQALNILTAGGTGYTEQNFIDNNSAIAVCNIDFGRWLWDPQLALDPSRFRNLQLKVTHNKALGGSAPDAGTLSVFADIFDDKRVMPIGFLQAKEHYTYSLTSSAVETIDLPTDYPLRNLIVQSLSTGKQPHDQYNKLKLIEDDGKKVPINDIRTSDLIKMTPNNKYMTETVRISNNTSAFTCYCTPTYDTKIVWAPILGTDSGWLGKASYGGTFTADGSAATEGDCILTGKGPHGALCIPFGIQDDITDWYDMTNIKSLKLKVTAGSSVGSSSTAEIVVQQLRRY